MSSGFESIYERIIKRKERGRPETRGRKAVTRVEVPVEFTQPQPAMARPKMGVFLPARKGRKRR